MARAPRSRPATAAATLAALLAACGGTGDGGDTGPRSMAGAEAPAAEAGLVVTEVATGLDTPWSMAFDAAGDLWFTERPGRVTKLGSSPENVPGVLETGESGLHGIVFDGAGRRWLYYTTATDNRVVRYDADGPKPIVTGINRAAIHDGGRLAVGPDGAVYAGTGDAAMENSAQDDNSKNGKILRIDPVTGASETFSKGHRNVQGLCFEPSSAGRAGRFLQTEHGPDRGDEVNVITKGLNGGWPGTAGNGIKNWTPTIAPAGCAVYDAGLIPGWKGSMLLVTLKEQDLRRLTFNPDGSVAGEEILFDEAFGRLRDVLVGSDGAVYLATSNQDGRGNPGPKDDRILRIAPKP